MPLSQMVYEGGKNATKAELEQKCCCQNFTHTKWPQHVSAFLWEPQWLSVKYQIDFKIAWMASEAQQLGVAYLSELVSVHEPGSLTAGVKHVSTCSQHKRG